MYKTLGGWMMKRNIAKLNEGDYGPVLAMYADDATLAFPGDNGFASQLRPVVKGRKAHVTHRGKGEIEEFLKVFVANGIQMEIEDLLMAGPPWKVRFTARAHVWSPGPDGDDRYTNRAIMYGVLRWGKLIEHEDYEDSERSAAFADVLGLTERATTPPAASTVKE